ncbi:DUF255 domain-containing protein [Thiorhodovibrio winogradskyi]|nr:DUF255 domain-containing protein [Thiorhodovibrio winogradskyi]
MSAGGTYICSKCDFHGAHLGGFMTWRLNRDVVAIKVDREMHPDVDETYMRALLLIKGQGG